MSPRSESSDTRERILDVAEALFAERGFAGVAIRDIARESQLTPASLYNHFAGKQALYESVLERGIRPLIELLGTLRAERSTVETTTGIIRAIMLHLASRPQLAGLVQHEAITGGAALVPLARNWIRPLLAPALLRMKAEPGSPWSEADQPHVIFAWLHLVLGYFALAPLMREVLDEDPLAPAALERQTAFLAALATRIMAGGGSAETPGADATRSTPPTAPANGAHGEPR